VFRRVPRAGVKRERGAADNGQSLCCPRNGKCARAYQLKRLEPALCAGGQPSHCERALTGRRYARSHKPGDRPQAI